MKSIPPPVPATLACQDCGHANEVERVYCHNCGVKLDRSSLPAAAAPDTGDTRRRPPVNKLAPKSPWHPTKLLSEAFKILIYSCFAGALVQAVRPPPDVPELTEDAVLTAPMIVVDMQDAAAQPKPVRLVYTESQVNGYLKNAIRAKKENKSSLSSVTKFERIYARLNPGEVHMGVAQSVFGYALHAGIDMEPTFTLLKKDVEVLGGNFGRLHVPGPVMKYLRIVFSRVWTALEQDKKALKEASRLTVEKGAVSVEFHTAR